MNSKIRTMCYIALMAALLCISAPYTINAGLIPISLASFVVYLSGAVLGLKAGTAAVGIYILLGAVGLPVFSNFGAGFAKIAGATGGYILGYLPCAAITGIGAQYLGDRKINCFGKQIPWSYPVFMLAGTFVLYLIGTVWFVVNQSSTFANALPLCVFPFLPGDAIKIVVASVLGSMLRGRLKKLRLMK